ncbi:MAG: TraB/GumN family protein [Gammaproteobacteria bacterium]|nr:TraB/GumN family protein [Gammaproteobacteria bacterium]
MNNIFKIRLYLLFFVSFSSLAGSPVWKLSHGDRCLYLGGTIHLLGKQDYPLPEVFKRAYQQSSVIVFETDMQKAKTPEFQQLMTQKLVFSNGQTIKDVIDNKTFKRLADYAQANGIAIANLMPLKPGLLVMVLTISELQRLGIANAGVDEFYHQKALSDHKQTDFLETIEEQLQFFVNMGKGNESEFVNYSLSDLKDMSGFMGQMKQAWRQGDNQLLGEIALVSWKEEFPQLYEEMLVKRNNNWMPKIEKMLTTDAVEMVLVGALHLVGEDGVIAQLKARGYQVVQMQNN